MDDFYMNVDTLVEFIGEENRKNNTTEIVEDRSDALDMTHFLTVASK